MYVDMDIFLVNTSKQTIEQTTIGIYGVYICIRKDMTHRILTQPLPS